MKKFISSLMVLTMTMSFSAITHAETTNEPVIDDYLSVVDATRYVITGTAAPNAMIHVADGPETVESVQADSDGDFEMNLPLRQNTINIYQIYAQSDGETASSWVTVSIQENATAADTAEHSSGDDHTAPQIPVIIDWEVSETELTATIAGSGETGTAVMVNGEESGETVSSLSTFEVTVDLTGGGTEDHFEIALKDDADLYSPVIELAITSELTEAVEEEDDSTEDGADASDDSEDDTTDDSSDDSSSDDADDSDDSSDDSIDDEDETDEQDEEDEAESFTDTDGHWSEAYVVEIAEIGAADGYADGSFGVDRSITRAELLAMAYRTFNGSEDGIQYDSSEEIFEDVDDSMWHQSLFHWAYEEGIIGGYETETGIEARPNANITRAEALKVIFLTADALLPEDYATPPSDMTSFPDISDEDWFYSIAYLAMTYDIMGGIDGDFAGNENVTRSQAAKILILTNDNLAELTEDMTEESTVEDDDDTVFEESSEETVDIETADTDGDGAVSLDELDDDRADLDPTVETI